jgi:hypothetical protein
MKHDPKPWDEMTSQEKRTHAAKLRAEMKELKPDPEDDSLQILQTALVSTDNPH